VWPRRRIPAEDPLACILVDLRVRELLPGPVDAEFAAVGAARDAHGAVQMTGSEPLTLTHPAATAG